MENADFILNLARSAIEKVVKEKKKIPVPEKFPKELKEKTGVFVTIYKRVGPAKELRGCIGWPYPEKPLIEKIIESSIDASKDPRFAPLREEELKDIEIEISILTEPKLIEVKNPKEYLKKIEIGKDGLIIKKGIFGGLLLPQVAEEHGWNAEEYLENLCYKAGLLADSWLDPSAKIYKFQAEIIKG